MEKIPPSPALLIFETHPIQYRSPIFRLLEQSTLPTRVIYFNQVFDAGAFWFHERGKSAQIDFDLDLTQGFKNETLGLQSHSFFSKIRLLWRALKSHPKVVLIYGYYLPEHWIVWMICRLKRIPLIFVAESMQKGTGVRKVFKKIMWPLFFGGVRRVIATGKKSQAFYKEIGIGEEKILLAPYCVENTFFSRPLSPACRKQKREELGLGEEDFVVLFVGRLFPRKRPLDVVRAAQQVKQEPLRKNVHFLMVGGGELEAPIRAHTESLTHLSLLPFCSQQRLSEIYALSDMLWVPSEYETWGLVINEAMSAGLPVCATKTCGASEDLLVSGWNGKVVEVGDIPSVLAFVSELQASEKNRDEMGKRAQQRVHEHYKIENFADTIRQACEEVTKEEVLSYQEC